MMMGIILIYFIGKRFYDLATEYNKHQWGYAIIGVISYYAGAIGFGVLLGIASLVIPSFSIDEINDIALKLLDIPFGLLACWGIFKLTERSFKKKTITTNTDSLDDYLIS